MSISVVPNQQDAGIEELINDLDTPRIVAQSLDVM